MIPAAISTLLLAVSSRGLHGLYDPPASAAAQRSPMYNHSRALRCDCNQLTACPTNHPDIKNSSSCSIPYPPYFVSPRAVSGHTPQCTPSSRARILSPRKICCLALAGIESLSKQPAPINTIDASDCSTDHLIRLAGNVCMLECSEP